MSNIDISTLEGQYVFKNLGSALSQALREICLKRPQDPIDYLAHWLYNHADRLKEALETEERERILAEELSVLQAEDAIRQARRDEEREFRRQREEERRKKEDEERKQREREDLQKRQREAIKARGTLPVVREEEEEAIVSRDENGRTEFLVACAEDDLDLPRFLSSGHRLSERDKSGHNALAIAKGSGKEDNVTKIEAHIVSLVSEGKVAELDELIVADMGDEIVEVATKILGEEAPAETLEHVRSFTKEIAENAAKITQAIQDGQLRQVEMAFERAFMAKKQDAAGRTPLIVALEYENYEIADWIVTNHPESRFIRNNVGQRPIDILKTKLDTIPAEMLEQIDALSKRLE